MLGAIPPSVQNPAVPMKNPIHGQAPALLKKLLTVLALVTAWSGGTLRAAEEAAERSLLDLKVQGAEKHLIVRNEQETVAASTDVPGVVINFKPGTDKFPGVTIKPEGASWDLSKYGCVSMKVTNLSDKTRVYTLSLKGKDEGTTSAANVRLEPKKTETFSVYFGYQWNDFGGNYFDSSAIPELIFFTKTVDEECAVRIESIVAQGKAGDKQPQPPAPPVNPNSVATKPADGVLLGGTSNVPKQISGADGAKGELAADGKSFRIDFAGGKPESVKCKPPIGMWNFGDHLQIRTKIKNIGQSPVKPSVRLESTSGPSAVIAATAPIAPGADAEIIVPFEATVPWKGIVDPKQDVFTSGKGNWEGEPGTGTKYVSNRTNGVTILSDATPGAKSLQISSIIADLPKPPKLPSWLGQRPPVDGEWTKTFEDNFDGQTIDLHKWNVHAPNYGEKRMHFSKDNVILKDGKMFLHFEKKRGRHNDDPRGKETDYATGWADTYGKWVQRYGYFESRVKLAKAPCLFPAFWLMPDRGAAVGPAWKRAHTAKLTATVGKGNDAGIGGMEMDIFENLSIWGPYRTDFCMHWDGYGASHKSCGYMGNYFQPDKEGFVTFGMLWTPGSVVFYTNGKETGRWDSPRISDVQSYVIFDHVMGGWEKVEIDDSQLPQDLVIDYVRVWQRKDLASPVDGPIANDGPLGTQEH